MMQAVFATEVHLQHLCTAWPPCQGEFSCLIFLGPAFIVISLYSLFSFLISQAPTIECSFFIESYICHWFLYFST
jgi:hypothetical protein